MDTPYLQLLDKIEDTEWSSLVWGDTNGSLSETEVLQWAESLVEEGESGQHLLEALHQRRLIFELKGRRLRSRFAETVRLLSHLKQWFPDKPWQSATRLVSDFRIDLRKRNYPKRNRPAITVRSEHDEILNTSSLRKELWVDLAEKKQMQLSAFQERSIVRLLSNIPDSGTIITSGTGSGKTLAYYLPVLLKIGDLIQNDQYWVKALSIYPRTELLKDQLAETFKRARMLDNVLIQNKRRPILMGALFASTPFSINPQYLNWPKRRNSFVCPWFSCPKCGEDLIWRDEDIDAQRERLNCTQTNCETVVDENQLVLTRTSLTQKAPDILFTTTEMLNQRMSDIGMRKLFGLGKSKNHKPHFMLLDEAHTYVGTSGAQAALVLRRWRYLLDSPVVWCGLSATLREAPRFFSELTGLNPDRVVEITPNSEELVEEGAEYQLILRGDPTLQASLLSTSIQSAMLLARMLDPIRGSHSEGVFGKRLFVFTDDLDVTNRLFDNLRDAEAYDLFGRPDGTRSPLAALRGREPPDPKRDADGQRWQACEKIGRDLNERLEVGRTSSQDSGVHTDADVIVATAALEVGYDDEDVGAVLQHKTPRNHASFLQRKGRAGRIRGMRPMTLTVLSEYGRDRISFQAYEHLFDPSIEHQPLPIQNQYVLRIQAVFSLMDWLSMKISHQMPFGWLWNVLSRPVEKPNDIKLKKEIQNCLKDLIRNDIETINSLSDHIKDSLCLSDEQVQSVLWDPPRSIMLEVIPTLLRRIFSEWKLAYPVEGVTHEFQIDYHPLPDFAPRTLFSDLSLPEVHIELPPATKNADPSFDDLPIVQAIQQLAPGRVTRRFAYQRGALCHWVAIEVTDNDQQIPIQEYAKHYEMVGEFESFNEDGSTFSLPVYRPLYVALSEARSDTVLPTSNAFPIWHSEFIPLGKSLDVPPPPKSSWFEYVSDVHFYLHRFRSSVAVRRFTPEVHASLKQRSGECFSRVKFADPEGKEVALGFEIEVDGFYVDFGLPQGDDLSALRLPSDLITTSRLAYHRHKWKHDPELPIEVSHLDRDWIHQILLSAALVKAFEENTSLGNAADVLLENNPEEHFKSVMRSLFLLHELSEEDYSEEENTSQLTRLEERIKIQLEKPEVLSRLKELAHEFDKPDPKEYSKWLRLTLHETLAVALLQACINTSPKQAATDTLISDFNHHDPLGRVWITETTIGGGGVIQAFADAFTGEPRSLFRALEASLAPTDMELSSTGLKRFVFLACEDEEIQEIITQIRSSEAHDKRQKLRKTLHKALMSKGLDVSHALSVSIQTRFLRPGMKPEVDKLLKDLLEHWERLETQFNLAIGLREFCFVALKLPGIRERLNSLVGLTSNSSDAESIQILSGLMWPRGLEIRQQALESYNPFRRVQSIDPALVRALLLNPNIPQVEFGKSAWQELYIKSIAENGTMQLVAQRQDETKLRHALVQVVITPVDVGFLQFFPIIERFERSEVDTKVTLTLREQV